MRVFVGYHFEDRWVKDQVYPLIKAFDHVLVNGEKLYGEGDVGEAVRKTIKTCEALIGFVTLRADGEGKFNTTTHRWVTDEIACAIDRKLKIIEVRETGVDLGTIGLFALVGTPYTIKFLWAPVVDALDLPVLSTLLGRRRGWLVFSQILLIASIDQAQSRAVSGCPSANRTPRRMR